MMLIDDEPFILQGLQILIDWKREGYEIVATMTNGKEALDYLRENEVDLIISDIQMPIMTGLELLETIQRENVSKARFAILTGYDDFSFAQRAIRNNSMDYILKPVQKEDMLALLRNVSHLEQEKSENQKNQQKLEEAYLEKNILALIKGKYDETNLEYVKKHLQLDGDIRYVEIAVVNEQDEIDESDLRLLQHQLLQACRESQKENSSHFVFDVSYDENNYDVGFVYCNHMATRHDMTEKKFLQDMQDRIQTILLRPVKFICGKRVLDIAALAKSYSSCCMLNSIKGFRNEKKMYLYEEEVQAGQNASYLCKNSIDSVIKAIMENDRAEISAAVEKLYQQMQNMAENNNVVNLNINYLLFQLIHIATQQDDKVNQEEVLHYIAEHSFEKSFARGSYQHMKCFSEEYADYLASLRKNVSKGLIYQVDEEIALNYAQNITLKSLGEKFFINSSYLGQLFRRAHDMSFKDYLTKTRVDEAVKLLVTTDEKINKIAEEVGYRDCDYFIRKFIELKGCTPSKFRRNHS